MSEGMVKAIGIRTSSVETAPVLNCSIEEIIVATQEENEKNPEWLMKQIGRYKEELSLVTRQRDEAQAMVRDREALLHDLQVKSAKQAGDHASAIVAMKQDANQKAAGFQAVQASLQEEKDRHQATEGLLTETQGQVESLKAKLAEKTRLLEEMVSLSQKRRKVLGEIMVMVGNVAKEAATVLGE